MHGDLYRRTGEGLRLDTGPFSRGWRRRPGRRQSRPASPRRPSSSPLWRAAAERFRHIPGTIRPRTGPGPAQGSDLGDVRPRRRPVIVSSSRPARGRRR
jgi:hypothetical protein